MRAIYLARESRISSAVLFQRNGFGLSFHALIQARTSFCSAATLLLTPRRRSWSVSRPNQRSTWLIQEDPLGVKSVWNGGCWASQWWIALVLGVARLSQTR